MKIFLFILISIAILSTSTYGQGGWGDDPGLLDSIVIDCDSLIVGRSMPISVRVVNDDPLRTILTNFTFQFIDGAAIVFDSLKFLNYLLDPSVLDLRFSRATNESLTVYLQKIIGNDLAEGGSDVIDYYFTATSIGRVKIDSLSLPPSNDFAFFAQLPDRYVGYSPQFQKMEFRIVEGSPFPILNISDKNLTINAGNAISTNITLNSPVGYTVELSIKEFTRYDNSEITSNSPSINTDGGYTFEWTPTVSDIGIWKAIIEGCDSSGACIESEIIVQVVESENYLIDFTQKSIPNFHQPEKMEWVDLDNDLYPEIITVGYNADLKSTFAVYDYDNFSIGLGYQSHNAQYHSHLALGYIDNDEILDVMYPSYNGNSLLNVVPGIGENDFDIENVIMSPISEPVSRNAVLNDFNKDEYLDYAASGGNKVFLFKGLGTGYFTQYFEIELTEKVRSINSADFNLNGTNDLAIGTDAGVYIYQNLGNGTFNLIEFYPQSYGAVDIDITNNGSDFNGDRYFDFVITTPSVGGEFSEIVLYQGKPNGTFDVTTVRTLKGQVFGNCIGDFNNDNNLDIAFVNGAHKYIGILYGEGDGSFVNEQRYYISDIPIFSINCVDFDLDGDLDISSVGTDNNRNGTLFLLENQDNSESLLSKSFELDILNNADMQLTSPGGKVMNNVSNSFTASSSYLKNIDNNSQIDKYYTIKTVEDGVYQVELAPKIDLQPGELFSAEFFIDKVRYSLAKNIPMSSTGYKFLIYPSEVSPVNPIPGQYTGENKPYFTWEMSGEVNFQLATDIDFSQLIIDSVLSDNKLASFLELSVIDTTAYYWRVKPTAQTDYDGIYVFNLIHKVPTDIDDDINGLPVGFVLSQNYPNPFNPTTQLSFSLPERSHVKMEIFNIVGQMIRTLTDAEYQAGEHTVEWDGNDLNGRKTASGIYLMKFTTEKFSKSVKMIMMK